MNPAEHPDRPSDCTRQRPTGGTFTWSDPGATGRPLRLAVSRRRPPRWVAALAGRLSATVVPVGSAGAKTAAVLDGAVGASLRDGGQHEWDSAGHLTHRTPSS
jgi:3'-phosphoadenosine 5'-phosphosulfate (PAPS) 3'-phosphatase